MTKMVFMSFSSSHLSKPSGLSTHYYIILVLCFKCNLVIKKKIQCIFIWMKNKNINQALPSVPKFDANQKIQTSQFFQRPQEAGCLIREQFPINSHITKSYSASKEAGNVNNSFNSFIMSSFLFRLPFLWHFTISQNRNIVFGSFAHLCLWHAFQLLDIGMEVHIIRVEFGLPLGLRYVQTMQQCALWQHKWRVVNMNFHQFLLFFASKYMPVTSADLWILDV